MRRFSLTVAWLFPVALLAADGTAPVTILDCAGDAPPENIKLCKSSDNDKCVTLMDKEQSCIRLEQHGGPSGGYWVITVKEKVNVKDHRYLKLEARSEPAAEMNIAFMTTTGKGQESFSTSFALVKEWKTYYIPLTQNDYGRGGFKFGRFFDGSDNDVFRAGRLTAVWMTPWAPTKRIFYVRDLRLTSEDRSD